MSEIFNNATARQQELLSQLAGQLGYNTQDITAVDFTGEVPTNVSWANTEGTFTRNAVPYLGGVINDLEYNQLLAERAQTAGDNIAQNAPVQPGTNEGGAQGRFQGSQLFTADTLSQITEAAQGLSSLDPRTSRLVASGLYRASDGSQANRSQDPVVRFRDVKDTRVRITDVSGLITGGILAALDSTDGSVVFPYTPVINVTYMANYDSAGLTHSNYEYMFYERSSVEEINITGKFTARNRTEADYVLASAHFFKTATKMFYGNSTPKGLPPVVCRLNGHGDYQFNNVPIVITSFSQEFPEEMDYISTSSDSSRVPTLSTFSVTAKPLYSRQQASQFNYGSFASGAQMTKGYL